MKLTTELIPKTCSSSNLRTLIPNKYWDKLRKKSYEDAGYVCEICGDVGTNQGYRHKLECHETWHYNVTTRTQTLKGLISLCVRCHQAKHIGRAKYIGKYDEVIKHMKMVNKMTKREIEEYLVVMFETYAELSRVKWVLDVSLLTELCDIKESDVNKAQKKRLDENTKPPKRYYKKKKSKKSKSKTKPSKTPKKKTKKRLPKKKK